MTWTQPTLEGWGVRLEPLTAQHRDELLTICADPDVWQWQPQDDGPLRPEAWLDRWIESTLARPEMPFAVRRLADGRIVGSTRYLALEPAHRRIEIGGTFYSADARGTAVNPACKRLLFGHAFEVLGAERVELKCDARNTRSRRAIAALGAAEEGTLRHHMRLGDGFVRDTVYFSVLVPEWTDVRIRLESRLSRR